MEEKKQVTVSELKALLDAGKSRKEITKMFGWNSREAALIWSNPALKGLKKAKYSIGVTLVDDTPKKESPIPFPSGESL